MSARRDGPEAELPIRARDALVELLVACLESEEHDATLADAQRALDGAPDAARDVAPRAREALAAAALWEAGEAESARAAAAARLAAYREAIALAPRGADLRTRLEQARFLFAAGLYFEVHEVLEPAWMESSGDSRRILQGLIQSAAAWYHWRRLNRAGARSLASAAAAKLAGAPGEWNGFALERVRRCTEAWARWLDAAASAPAEDPPPLPFREPDSGGEPAGARD